MSGIIGSRFNTRGSGLIGSVGTDGQVFTSSGAGVSHTFEDAAGGAHIKLSTATASTSATVTLTGMDSTYQNYMIELDNIVNADDDVQLRFRFIQGGSTITDSDYESHTQRFSIPTNMTFLNREYPVDYIHMSDGGDNANDPQLNGRMFIYNAPTADAHTSFVSNISHQHYDNHDHQMNLAHGELANNTASTGIVFHFSSGNIDAGTFRLYGIS